MRIDRWRFSIDRL